MEKKNWWACSPIRLMSHRITVFSPAKMKTAEAEYSVAIGRPDYEITKTNWRETQGENFAEMGTALHYEIILRNRGILAYEELSYLEDPLNDYLYIRAEDIEDMLKDSECGRLLEITIDNATLCERVEKRSDAYGRQFLRAEPAVSEHRRTL